MNNLEQLLADLSSVKEQTRLAQEVLQPLAEEEARLRSELCAHMLDNGVKVATSPDRNWRVSLSERTSSTLSERDELLKYLLDAKRYLLSPDLVAVKKELKGDGKIAECFTISKEVSLTVSEIKEKAEPEESAADFRERVRNA